LVRSFRPDVNEFREFKTRLAAAYSPPAEENQVVELAFCLLATQSMSWSGWGGGVSGGYEQRYDRIGERWLPELTVKKIRFLNRRLNRVETRITALDFREVDTEYG